MSPVSVAQKESFRLALEALKETGLLSHVLVIGSWAEYLYQETDPESGFVKHLQTRDLDLFLENLRKPDNPAGIVEALKQRGFLLDIDRVTEVGKFYKEDLLEIQFLVRALGSAIVTSHMAPALSIRVEGLRDLDVLSFKPMTVEWEDYSIRIPSPEAFVLQKLLIQDYRQSWKREKDIEAVRMVLSRLVRSTPLIMHFNHLSDSRKKRIVANAKLSGITLHLSNDD